MGKKLEMSTHYRIKYTNHDPIPIDSIVKSLLAYERIILLTPAFIEISISGY